MIDDLLAAVGNNTCFTILDLKGAYLQLELDPESRRLTTINTSLGLYFHKRLPYGVKTAPAIFQSTIDKVLHGIIGVLVYFDDILILGSSFLECYDRVCQVLSRLIAHNIQVNFGKCQFFKSKVEYLGHEVSALGISPCKSKVEGIAKMPPPKDLSALRSFLGAVNFYGKFLKDLQTHLHPLYCLLKKDVPFKWTSECQDTFEKVKLEILKSALLVHYDPNKPLVLVCDAGPYGVGAVLNVVINDQERPCFMISSTLSQAERNYSQLHREALAIVFAVKKFHKFIFGHKVVVYTDCKALESLLSNEKNLNTVINSRFIRWILLLQNYDLEIKFRSSKLTAGADALSRLPLNESTEIEKEPLSSECLNLFNDDLEQKISIEDVKKETRNNPVCQQVMKYIVKGWPQKVPIHLRPFYDARLSLDIENECIFYGNRLFIPNNKRAIFLDQLHREHVGIIKCKQLARRSIWWPKINSDIENYVLRCTPCNLMSVKRRDFPLMSWEKTSKPFERIHLDHFFLNSKIYLVIIDVHCTY